MAICSVEGLRNDPTPRKRTSDVPTFFNKGNQGNESCVTCKAGISSDIETIECDIVTDVMN